jgi:hypothetical protein
MVDDQDIVDYGQFLEMLKEDGQAVSLSVLPKLKNRVAIIDKPALSRFFQTASDISEAV